jgi:hypothetical protein
MLGELLHQFCIIALQKLPVLVYQNRDVMRHLPH